MSIIKELRRVFDEKDFEKFKALVDALEEVDFMTDDFPVTPFVMLSSEVNKDNQRLKFLDYLIEKGAQVDQTCGSMSPLSDACGAGDLDLIKFLVDRGADVNYSEASWLPILRAIAADEAESLRFLLENPSIDLKFAQEAAYGDTLGVYAKSKKAKSCMALLKSLKIK